MQWPSGKGGTVRSATTDAGPGSVGVAGEPPQAAARAVEISAVRETRRMGARAIEVREHN